MGTMGADASGIGDSVGASGAGDPTVRLFTIRSLRAASTFAGPPPSPEMARLQKAVLKQQQLRAAANVQAATYAAGLCRSSDGTAGVRGDGGAPPILSQVLRAQMGGSDTSGLGVFGSFGSGLQPRLASAIAMHARHGIMHPSNA